MVSLYILLFYFNLEFGVVLAVAWVAAVVEPTCAGEIGATALTTFLRGAAVTGIVINSLTEKKTKNVYQAEESDSDAKDGNSVNEKKETKVERRKRHKAERKARKANERASDDYVKKNNNKLPKDQKRQGHDKKQKGEPDRSRKQIDEDYNFN